MKTQIYLYDGNTISAELSVKERSDGQFNLRAEFPLGSRPSHFEVFETYSAALARMYEMALDHTLEFTKLRMFGKKMKARVA